MRGRESWDIHETVIQLSLLYNGYGHGFTMINNLPSNARGKTRNMSDLCCFFSFLLLPASPYSSAEWVLSSYCYEEIDTAGKIVGISWLEWFVLDWRKHINYSSVFGCEIRRPMMYVLLYLLFRLMFVFDFFFHSFFFIFV